MKNYQIEGKDGKKYWIHRAITTVENIENKLKEMSKKEEYLIKL